MSTKIYNTYRVKEGHTIEDVMGRLKTARKTYHGLITNFLEVVFPTYKKEGIDDYFKLMDLISDICKNDILNFSASFMIYFFEGRIYIQYFGLAFPIKNTIFQDLFADITDDYHYQSQADRWFDYTEDDVERTEEFLQECERDWEERERVWTSLLGDHNKFNTIGLSYDLFNHSDSFDVCYPLMIKKHEVNNEKEV